MDTRIFDDLSERSKNGEIVFRIWHDSTPQMPKLPPPLTDLPDSNHNGCDVGNTADGFSADHPFFLDMSKDRFRRIDIDVSPSPRHVWIQESIVKQVKGDLAWVERSVKRDVQLEIPEPPHSRRCSSRRLRLDTGLQAGRLIRRESDLASVSMATRATAGSLIDLDDPDTNVMDELASVFSDATSMAETATPRQNVQSARVVGQPDAEENLSPWIVTHGNLEWAIHRITRLLTRGTAPTVHLTVIKLDTDSLEYYTKSESHLELLKANQAWGTAERQTLAEAVRFAKNSKEVLFYGRIFPESCEATYTWTRNVSTS
jgi:hypothetical protein